MTENVALRKWKYIYDLHTFTHDILLIVTDVPRK